MSKAGKIAISLPEELLTEVEQERVSRGETRSEFFRHAAEELLRHRRERGKIEQYVRGYTEAPETEEEIEAARRAASIILASEPWE